MDDRNTAANAEGRTAPDDAPQVAALSDLGDFQVAEGYPDPRGWDVVGTDGRKLGKVHDLIVDTGEMRTRYLDVSLDKDAIAAKNDRDVLVPVGNARLDDGKDCVVLGSLSRDQLALLPVYDHGRITREYEAAVLGSISGRNPAAADTRADPHPGNASDYYASDHFDDRKFFGTRGTASRMGDDAHDATPDNRANEARVTRSEEEMDIGKRQVQAGEVDVHKRVETEHVSQPVSTRREEVTIERRPVRAEQAASTANVREESVIRIPITEEQLVVEKKPVVKEEIVITKHMVTDDRTVDADLRKERVDIDRSREQGASPRDDDHTSRR